ncbi:MAG TPA: hypothetical protein V6C57_06830 [Coleofasciculaceae cyanobacterium]
MIFIKSLVVWLVFILAESLNGTLRIFWLVPSLGEVRAEQLSFVSGSILVLVIATLFIRWLQPSRLAQLIGVGVLWLVLTVGFELILGRVILGYSWEKIAADYTRFKGGLMPLELIWLLLSPWMAAKIRGVFPNPHQTAAP